MIRKPRSLYTARQVREFDRISIEDRGIDGYVLMCRAGAAAFDLMRARWPHARAVRILCGSGNNGGDGYVLGKLAVQAGLDVEVMAAAPAKSPTALLACADYEKAGGRVVEFDRRGIHNADLVVDGMLGTGLAQPLSGKYRDIVGRVNAAQKPVLGLDIPSGLNSDTGTVMGVASRCEATITFIGAKLGLFTGDGPSVAGNTVLDDLDVPADIYSAIEPTARIIDPPADGIGLARRCRTMHKGSAGRVLVVGGGEGMPGSVRMAAHAAYRAGAGLVQVATYSGHARQVTATCPEIMAVGVDGPADLDLPLNLADVVAIGPGLGTDSWARTLLECVLASGLPMVVDADALNLIAQTGVKRDNWILTPHPGEAGRLADTATAAVQADRIGTVSLLRRKYGGVIVLKGAGTLVRDDDLWLCSRGNPGMATGGMGDVLTGVISGLIAQGQSLSSAGRYGVWLHAEAADRAARENGEIGLMATDLLPFVRKIVNE